MFQNEELKEHLETSFSVESAAVVIAEWNMNVPGNIFKLGNYRYRQNSTQYSVLPSSFDSSDLGNFYTGATDADITVDYGFKEDSTTPQAFTYKKDKEKQLYSLEDCLKPFRPRSGINKLSWFPNKYISFPNKDMYLRPRYYMPTKDDEFKYWRSYRTESNLEDGNNIEYGISKNNNTGVYLIEDCNPFVVYKEAVPANRIVVKVQTNVGSIDLGPFKTNFGSDMADPFFGESNKTVPKIFKIQYLNQNNEWVTAYDSVETNLISDNIESILFTDDGHLSLEYGLETPEEYEDTFFLVSTLQSTSFLPEQNIVGAAYLIIESSNDIGSLFIFNGEDYDEVVPVYKWFLSTDEITNKTNFVTDLTNPSYYVEAGSLENVYREFVWLKGIRVVVETMNTPDTPLELIEISPRLLVNLSNGLVNFNITKSLADLSGSALPVGQLLASVGDVTLFDDDNAFNSENQWNFDTNSGSIIAKHIEKNIKFIFYEVIKNVNDNNYYIPIKTMYSESFPKRDARTGETSIELRDFYFHFESLQAPRILITEASLSQAVCLILDSIGFSNYIFKRLESESDPVIPYFFIPPDQSIAEILSSLARATQSAMFFDEYNNFVVMTKEYILDTSSVRETSTVLSGSNSSDGKLANIIAIASKDKKVYNAGTINYTSRYIKKTGGTIAQSRFLDKEYVYNPSLLWEVAGNESLRSENSSSQTGFALSAAPLNTTLSADIPIVSEDRIIINNTFDVGENAYWLSRYQGMFYANGEIIKYDAVEYNITGIGNVWISSNLEYQKYFSRIPFNGKMYPTGLIRIYAEPFYETISGITITENNRETTDPIVLKRGAVVSHGRGQFGTPIVSHQAGLDSYWTDNANIQGCNMDSSLLYSTTFAEDRIIPTIDTDITQPAGLSKTVAEKTQRNGIIRNFLSSKYISETEISSLQTTKTGSVQSSALIMTGPDFEDTTNPRDHVSYVYKNIDGAYKHFGTRVRIIGKVEAAADRSQSVVGGMSYFNLPGTSPTDTITLGGGSAGISLINPNTNNGYYFEIAALTSSDLDSLLKKDDSGNATISIENILFYKIRKNDDDTITKAVPVRLWGGVGNIIVDDGNFVGQYRFSGEENPTVYDLAIEYVDIDATRRDFYLYINQTLIARITDNDPISFVNSSIGLFVRGSSKAMFENIYALGKNYATNTVFDTNIPIASIFGDSDGQIGASEALKKYALSGIVQNTYLSGIRPQGVPDYAIYFEEFGTILRECAYFNIKYDRAYPALYAKIAPTFNRVKGYTVSGFTADSYGAEFLVFNNTDTVLTLDDKTSNYLRILGIAFTQDTTNSITVDDYLKKRGNVSDPELRGSELVESPFKFLEQYEKVKQSRMLYGKNDFTLESVYIQNQEAAEEILGWIIEKNIRPRKQIGIRIFAMPILQLGDIVTINYKDENGINLVSEDTTRYVIYNIGYNRSNAGADMTIYLSEV